MNSRRQSSISWINTIEVYKNNMLTSCVATLPHQTMYETLYVPLTFRLMKLHAADTDNRECNIKHPPYGFHPSSRLAFDRMRTLLSHFIRPLTLTTGCSSPVRITFTIVGTPIAWPTFFDLETHSRLDTRLSSVTLLIWLTSLLSLEGIQA